MALKTPEQTGLRLPLLEYLSTIGVPKSESEIVWDFLHEKKQPVSITCQIGGNLMTMLDEGLVDETPRFDDRMIQGHEPPVYKITEGGKLRLDCMRQELANAAAKRQAEKSKPKQGALFA